MSAAADRKGGALSGDRGYPPGNRRPERQEDNRALAERVAEMTADMRHLVGNLEQYRSSFADLNRTVANTRDELGRKLDEVIKPLTFDLRKQGDEIGELRDRIGRLETTVGYLRLVVFGFVGIILTGFVGALVSLAQISPGTLP